MVIVARRVAFVAIPQAIAVPDARPASVPVALARAAFPRMGCAGPRTQRRARAPPTEIAARQTAIAALPTPTAAQGVRPASALAAPAPAAFPPMACAGPRMERRVRVRPLEHAARRMATVDLLVTIAVQDG